MKRPTILNHTLKTLILIFTVCFSVACSQSSEPDQIRATIETMQNNLEEGDISAFLEAIDDQFLLNQKQDKKWLQGVLAYHYLKKRKVETAITNLNVEWNEENPEEATVSITAFAAKFANWVPEEGRSFRLETQWLKTSGDWTLYRVEWLNPPDGYRHY